MARDIQILSDLTIDQIAAGEVVERPASVVKELVENALDAGASHISVEIEGGGKKRIRICDNGCGMSATAIEMALRRHATSKLRTVDDLSGIATFGFRGEALPSIAAVSRLTITSRERTEDTGLTTAHRVSVLGGKIVENSAVGAPVGTCVDIADLLYNVPARQKFLKADVTEMSHITDTMNKMALANPGVHFRLKNALRTTLNAPRHKNSLDRIRSVMGTRLGKGLWSSSGEYGGVQVEAYLTSPEFAQSTTRALQLFVGRRPVRDRGVLSAVMQGYAGIDGQGITNGRYPAAVLLIDTPNEHVDVNVHPQKLEVRFSDPQLVYAAVRQVVRAGVESAPWVRLLSANNDGGAAPNRITGTAPPRIDAYSASPATGQTVLGGALASPLAVNYAREYAKKMWPNRGDHQNRSSELSERAWSYSGKSKAVDRANGASEPGKASVRPASTTSTIPGDSRRNTLRPRGNFFASLRYLGQLDRSYLLCEADGELVILDQHAAEERVEVAKLREQYRDGTIPTQRLLLPQRVELSREQASVADAYDEQLAGMGFELDDAKEGTGNTSYALKSVPGQLRDTKPEDVLFEVLNKLVVADSAQTLDARIAMMLATIACHSTFRLGDTLECADADALLRALDEADLEGKGGHRRPLFHRISVDEIARRIAQK